MTGALPAWRHNGRPPPCCRESGWSDAKQVNNHFELGFKEATELNCGPSLATAVLAGFYTRAGNLCFCTSVSSIAN
jgi:hypothetical protein